MPGEAQFYQLREVSIWQKSLITSFSGGGFLLVGFKWSRDTHQVDALPRLSPFGSTPQTNKHKQTNKWKINKALSSVRRKSIFLLWDCRDEGEDQGAQLFPLVFGAPLADIFPIRTIFCGWSSSFPRKTPRVDRSAETVVPLHLVTPCCFEWRESLETHTRHPDSCACDGNHRVEIKKTNKMKQNKRCGH